MVQTVTMTESESTECGKMLVVGSGRDDGREAPFSASTPFFAKLARTVA